MATKMKTTTIDNEQVNTFPIPFTLESFKNDILEVFLHYIRTVGRVIDNDKTQESQAAWRLTGLPTSEVSENLYNPEYRANDLELKYEDIQDFMLAEYLESLYEFAFYGRRDPSAEAMEYESTYMWVTCLVVDALKGLNSEEWDSYGGSVIAEAANCVLVAETANARCILEDGKFFSHFSSEKDAAMSPSEDSLTIRQMALLSGMEEMSIRSAANKNRANQLVTHKGEKGSTRVTREAAKAWLIQKGRYIPITIYSNSSELNLSKQKFNCYTDLVSALEVRAIVIASKIGEDVVKKRLDELNIKNLSTYPWEKSFIGMNIKNFSDEPLIREIAELLELPQDLLVLRCKQTAAYEQIARIERELAESLNTPKLEIVVEGMKS
jgi:hypothetical protein